MTAPTRFTPKAPSELLDYKVDYTAELAVAGDAIQSSLWIVPSNTVDAPGNTAIKLADNVTLNEDPDMPSPVFTQGGTSRTASTTTIFLSGGTRGNVYRIINRIATTQGRKYSRILEIVIEPYGG